MSLSIYVVGVFAVTMVMLSSYFLGERSAGHVRAGKYESGIKGFAETTIPFFAHYFMLAILFVIFDMESVFIFLWSSAVHQLGWTGYLKMAFFVAMLVLGLFYASRSGIFLITKSSKRSLHHD